MSKLPVALPNGAIMLSQFEWQNGLGVVLAHSDHNDDWITWVYYRSDLSTTCHGHYFDNWDDAVDDYFERVNLHHERAHTHGKQRQA